MDNRDFGYFGKGSTGYAHYMTAFERNNKGGGSGGGKRNSNGGCLSCLLLMLLPAVSMTVLHMVR